MKRLERLKPYGKNWKLGRKTIVKKDGGGGVTTCIVTAEKVPNTAPAPTIKPPWRHWTNSELQARRDKGLCYRCDEPFNKGHCCKNKELRLYVVADELKDTEMEDVEMEDRMLEVSPIVELSLNLVVGLTTLGTFKLKGNLGD